MTCVRSFDSQASIEHEGREGMSLLQSVKSVELIRHCWYAGLPLLICHWKDEFRSPPLH